MRYGRDWQVDRKEVITIMKLEEKVRTVFEELAARTEDGCVTPEMVLKASEPEDSLLHDNFEWDDEKAGHSFRIWQARVLLNKMTLQVEGSEIREFENLVVRVDSKKVQGYFSIDRIMENKNLKNAVVIQVQKDLLSMLKKYKRYEKIYTVLSEAKRKIEQEAEAFMIQ
jgi:hypothetical protein